MPYSPETSLTPFDTGKDALKNVLGDKVYDIPYLLFTVNHSLETHYNDFTNLKGLSYEEACLESGGLVHTNLRNFAEQKIRDINYKPSTNKDSINLKANKMKKYIRGTSSDDDSFIDPADTCTLEGKEYREVQSLKEVQTDAELRMEILGILYRLRIDSVRLNTHILSAIIEQIRVSRSKNKDDHFELQNVYRTVTSDTSGDANFEVPVISATHKPGLVIKMVRDGEPVYYNNEAGYDLFDTYKDIQRLLEIIETYDFVVDKNTIVNLNNEALTKIQDEVASKNTSAELKLKTPKQKLEESKAKITASNASHLVRETISRLQKVDYRGKDHTEPEYLLATSLATNMHNFFDLAYEYLLGIQRSKFPTEVPKTVQLLLRAVDTARSYDAYYESEFLYSKTNAMPMLIDAGLLYRDKSDREKSVTKNPELHAILHYSGTLVAIDPTLKTLKFLPPEDLLDYLLFYRNVKENNLNNYKTAKAYGSWQEIVL